MDDSRTCPLCGNAKRMSKRTRTLYGHEICKKCFNAFMSYRQAGFLVDVLAFQLMAFFIGMALCAAMISIDPEVSDRSLDLAGGILGLALLPFFALKDGFGASRRDVCSPARASWTRTPGGPRVGRLPSDGTCS